MESWQEPCGPDDLIELGYLGLNLVFGRQASSEQLLDCARDARDRILFYRSQWGAGKPFDDVQLADGPAARLRSLLQGNRGAFICTFQIGPFLQLPFLLANQGLRIMLLMDADNFEYGMDVCNIQGMGHGSVPYGFWSKVDPASREHATREPVNFVRSNDRSASWKMSRWLKSGNVGFAYMDGNQGLHAEYTEKNSVIVRFFGVDIWVRKGLAHLAGFTGAPLVFMICRKERDGHVIRLSPALRKREHESLDAFCQRAIRAGFRLLEAHIRQDVACWNEWCQLHRWAVRRGASGISHEPPLAADQALQRCLRVEPQVVQLRLGAQDVLVNHKTGTAILVTSAVADVLRLAQAGRTVEEILNELGSSYEEPNLLEVLHALAEDAFLQVSRW